MKFNPQIFNPLRWVKAILWEFVNIFHPPKPPELTPVESVAKLLAEAEVKRTYAITQRLHWVHSERLLKETVKLLKEELAEFAKPKPADEQDTLPAP